MKQTIFTLLLLSAFALVSCRKANQQNIQEYDQQQIQNYITANNLTGFTADSSGNYYKIIQQPNTANPALAYTDNVSFVFTLKSFDGKYISSDTVNNHFQTYIGHIVSNALPYGLELAMISDLKHYGGSMRVLIPSHLAYGVNGYGSGSITQTSTHIAGNQCLDYYVHVINAQHDSLTSISAATDQRIYDNTVINNYITANALTGYVPDSGVYYKIATQGTGSAHITQSSTIEVTFYGRLMNNTVFGVQADGDSVSVQVPNLIQGAQRILKKYGKAGSTISMLIPSDLGYGKSVTTGELATIPSNSCLRFEFEIISVTP